jgi:hypothetical protein
MTLWMLNLCATSLRHQSVHRRALPRRAAQHARTRWPFLLSSAALSRDRKQRHTRRSWPPAQRVLLTFVSGSTNAPAREAAQNHLNLLFQFRVRSHVHERRQCAAIGCPPFECVEQEQPARTVTCVTDQRDDITEDGFVGRPADRHRQAVFGTFIEFLAV